jgi:hypothetical protein
MNVQRMPIQIKQYKEKEMQFKLVNVKEWPVLKYIL